MYNHTPEHYICPFCYLVKGEENDWIYSRQADVFYRDAFMTDFIPSHSWPNNHANAITILNLCYENP